MNRYTYNISAESLSAQDLQQILHDLPNGVELQISTVDAEEPSAKAPTTYLCEVYPAGSAQGTPVETYRADSPETLGARINADYPDGVLAVTDVAAACLGGEQIDGMAWTYVFYTEA